MSVTSQLERLHGIRRLIYPFDLLASFACVYAALALRFQGDIPALHLLPYLTFLPVLLLTHLASAYACGLYDFRLRLSATEYLFSGIGAATLGVGLCYGFLAWTQLYYAQESNLSRAVVLINLVLQIGWYGVSRAVILTALHSIGYRIRILPIGPESERTRIAQELTDYGSGMLTIVDGISLESIANDADLNAIAEATPTQIILTTADFAQSDMKRLLIYCDHNNIELYLYPDLAQALLTNSRLVSLAGLPLVPLNCRLTHSAYALGKRLLDIVAASVGLILSLPLLGVAALAVRVSSKGPAFFIQERAGRLGEPFRMIKFRTMVVNAEAQTGPVLSTGADPRVTTVGRLLRRYRIDELPQLINVLRGEMSLVGPRPERLEFVKEYLVENPLYERRLLVRPGLTGLAQIHGRYDTEYTQKLRYDLIYINSVSLAMDLRILLATAHTVLTGRGAI